MAIARVMSPASGTSDQAVPLAGGDARPGTRNPRLIPDGLGSGSGSILAPGTQRHDTRRRWRSRRDGSGITVLSDFKLQLATEMPERLDHLEGATFVRGDTCPTADATTPDTYPIIDSPAEEPRDLMVATGLHIGGIMSPSPVAEAVRSLVTGTEAQFSLDPFRLERFDPRSSEFPFVRYMAETEITEARIGTPRHRRGVSKLSALEIVLILSDVTTRIEYCRDLCYVRFRFSERFRCSRNHV